MAEIQNTKKLCVFCGKLPDEKTKEHILPKWLLEFTDSSNGPVFLGMDLSYYMKTGKPKERKYALSAFHFPACSTCNSDFSQLEHHAKLVMHKLFAGSYLDNVELTILLDWFDKVRLGLWLAYTRLDDLSDEINPRLYINSRVRQKDRALFIYDFKDPIRNGLGFGGVNSPVFYQVPGCFSLRINSKLFVSASADFLTARSLGFPHGKLVRLEEEELHQMFDVFPGTERITYPVVSFPYAPGAMEIYQVISSRQLALELVPGSGNTLFNNSYLFANCLPAYSTDSVQVSKIFYKEKGTNKISILQEDEELELTPTIPKSLHAIEDIVLKMITKIQVWLFRRRFPTALLPESKSKVLLDSQASTFRAQKSFAGSSDAL